MKRKIFTTLAVFAALALTACGGGNQSEPAGKSEPGKQSSKPASTSKHTHTADENAPYKYDATNHWQECKDGDGGKVGSKAHTFVDDTTKTAVPASCETEGKKFLKCSVCGFEKEEAVPALGHVFEDNGAATGLVHPEIDRGCNTKAYRFDIAEATGWNTPDVKWNAKAAPTNQASWAIEEGQLPAGKYKVYLEATMSYDSHGSRYMFNENKTLHPKNPVTGEDYPDQSSSDPDTAEQSLWRYYFAINNGDDIYPDCSTTLAEIGYHGGSGAEKVFGLVLSEITIPAGITSFEARHGNIGYSLIVSRIRLVEIKAAA